MSKRDSKSYSTDTQLKNAKPAARRYELRDEQQRGLKVRVAPSGRKTFVWYFRDGNKKQHLVLIGTYPEMSIEKSRIEFRRLKKKNQQDKLYGGVNDVPTTVAELLVKFDKDIIAERKAPGAARQIFNHDVLPEIGHRKLDSVRPIDVTAMVQKVIDRGAKPHAKKLLALTKQLFNYAVAHGYLEVSPALAQNAKNVGIGNLPTRERNLDSSEIKALWTALDSRAHRMSDPFRIMFKILLLSGVRTGELRQAKWEHVDLENKAWFIPEENSKTRSWTVPLTSQLIVHFEALQGLCGGSEWVIPGRTGGPVTDKVPGRVMRGLFDKEILTCEKFTPHDLRRTLRTGLSVLKVDFIIAEKCLNHSMGKIADTYNQHEMLDERRDALEAWNDYVDLIVVERENVVLMEKQA